MYYVESNTIGIKALIHDAVLILKANLPELLTVLLVTTDIMQKSATMNKIP